MGYAIGKYFQRRAYDKGKFYQDLTAYLTLMKDNVTGRQLEMMAFNHEFAKSSCQSFADYIVNGELKIGLSKAQKENLIAFFGNLDCVSSQVLVDHINYHGKILTDDAQTVLQKEVVRSSIYSKIGMLLGAMLGILFV